MKKLRKSLVALLIALMLPVAGYADWNNYPYGTLIVLDPGHGGTDPGAGKSGYRYEADLVLDCCLAMRDWFKARGLDVAMTRTTDATVSLSARLAFNQAKDPEVFCSVHLNAFDGSAHGTETWHNLNYATRSVNLANKVQAQLINKLARTNRGVKAQNWTVITASGDIPQILTEGLFVDNVEENELINSRTKPGFAAWVNGHLKGFYDFITTDTWGCSLSTNPDKVPWTNGATTPTISTSPESLSFSCNLWEQPSQTVTVQGTKLSGNITVTSSDPSVVSVSPATLGASGGKVTVTLTGTSHSGNVDQRITFTSGTVSKTISVTGTIQGGTLGTLQEKWNLSAQRGNSTSADYDATKIRNFAYQDGKLYCVYNHNEIIVLNAQTGALLGRLKNGNIIGAGTLPLCDVKVNNGRIIACNLALSSANQSLRLYCWDNDEAEPRLLMETTDFQGATRIGDCLEITGTIDSDAWYAFCFDTGSESRIIEYHQTGTSSWSSKYTLAARGDGTYVPVGTTARAYPLGGQWWVDGNKCSPLLVEWDNAQGAACCIAANDCGGQEFGASHHNFTFGGKKYAAGLVFRGTSNMTGGKMRLQRIDNDYYTSTTTLQELPTDGLGTAQNTNGTGDVIVNTDGDNYLEAWVLSTTQGLAYFAYGPAPVQNPQPVNPPRVKFNMAGVMGERAQVGKTHQIPVPVHAENLKGAVTLSLTGVSDKADAWIEPTESTESDFTATIHYTPNDFDISYSKVTVSSPGAESKSLLVALSGQREPEGEIVVAEGESSDFGMVWLGFSKTKNYQINVDNIQLNPTLTVEGDQSQDFTVNPSWTDGSDIHMSFDNNAGQWDGDIFAKFYTRDNAANDLTAFTTDGTLHPLTYNGATGMWEITLQPASAGEYEVQFVSADGVSYSDPTAAVNGAVYSCPGRGNADYPNIAVPCKVSVRNLPFTLTFTPTALVNPQVDIVYSHNASEVARHTVKAMGVTGVEDIASGQQASIIVADGKITVAGASSADISVYSVSGVLVASAHAATTLDVTPLAPGTYIVTAVTPAQTLHAKVRL